MTVNHERGQQPIVAIGQIVKILLVLAVVGAVAWACLTSHDSSTSSQSTTPSPTYSGPRYGGGDAQYLDILKSHVFGITDTEGDAGLINTRDVAVVAVRGTSRSSLCVALKARVSSQSAVQRLRERVGHPPGMDADRMLFG